MTVTEFSRNLRSALDRIEHRGEEIILTRNNHRIARVLPGSSHQTALEAMADLYRTLPESAAKGWVEDGRSVTTLDGETVDPWDA